MRYHQVVPVPVPARKIATKPTKGAAMRSLCTALTTMVATIVLTMAAGCRSDTYSQLAPGTDEIFVEGAVVDVTKAAHTAMLDAGLKSVRTSPRKNVATARAVAATGHHVTIRITQVGLEGCLVQIETEARHAKQLRHDLLAMIKSELDASAQRHRRIRGY